jgi:hypothetical protein
LRNAEALSSSLGPRRKQEKFDMTIFAIIAPTNDQRLREAVNRVFPGKNFEFVPGQFVASAPGLTAAQVAANLGTNGQVGQYVVFSVAGHWGYHRQDLWEWLTANAS